MSDEGFDKGLQEFIHWSVVFAWPLAIWKSLEIVIWLCRHLNISWQ